MEYEHESNIFCAHIQMSEKDLMGNLEKLQISANAPPQNTSFREEIENLKKQLKCGSVTHLLLGVDLI